MKLAGLVVACWAAVAATGCKSAKECPQCTCPAAGAGAVAQAPSGEAAGKPAAGAPSASPTEPATVVTESAAKCSGLGCKEHEGILAGSVPPAVPPSGGPSAPQPLPPAQGPAEPVVVAPSAEPLAPGLAAHLGKLPADADVTFVLQADVRALLSADEVRTALGGLLELVRGEVPGDPTCVIELLASVELVTAAFFEGRGSGEQVALILEGGADLPGIAECAARVMPGELPPGFAAQAARGYVEIESDVALASLGPRTIVFGETGLVEEMRAGRVRRPLSTSRDFDAVRRIAGSGPITVVAMVRDRSGSQDESFSGSAVLRADPGLAASGAFTFASAEMVGEVIDEYEGAMGDWDEERAEVLGLVSGLPGGAALGAQLLDIVDAAAQARLTVQGKTLSFEVRAPAGVTAASLAGTIVRVAPLFLLRGGKEEDSAAVVAPEPIAPSPPPTF
jgi:hypothetical protein